MILFYKFHHKTELNVNIVLLDMLYTVLHNVKYVLLDILVHQTNNIVKNALAELTRHLEYVSFVQVENIHLLGLPNVLNAHLELIHLLEQQFVKIVFLELILHPLALLQHQLVYNVQLEHIHPRLALQLVNNVLLEHIRPQLAL
jgi:hypothetical protein